MQTHSQVTCITSRELSFDSDLFTNKAGLRSWVQTRSCDVNSFAVYFFTNYLMERGDIKLKITVKALMKNLSMFRGY